MSNTEMKEYRGVTVNVVAVDGPCYVANIDREKGITIHDKDDREVWCINRESFMKTSKHRDKNRFYHDIFTRAVQGIERGLVEYVRHRYSDGMTIWHRSESTIVGFVTVQECAFK